MREPKVSAKMGTGPGVAARLDLFRLRDSEPVRLKQVDDEVRVEGDPDGLIVELGPQLLGPDILLAHSSNRIDELIHGLAIEQPPEVEQGVLAAPEDTVDHVGETLPRSFHRFGLHVRGTRTDY